MAPSSPFVDTDEQILHSALRNEPKAWEALCKRFGSLVRTISRRRAPDLPDDLHSEVAQEVWIALANRRPEHFRTSGKSAARYVAAHVPNAIQRIRSDYREPQQPARRQRRAASKQTSELGAPLVPSIEYIVDSRWVRDLAHTDASIDLDRIAHRAPSTVRQALYAIRNEGMSFIAAAHAVGIDRMTLLRQLRRLALGLPPSTRSRRPRR